MYATLLIVGSILVPQQQPKQVSHLQCEGLECWSPEMMKYMGSRPSNNIDDNLCIKSFAEIHSDYIRESKLLSSGDIRQERKTIDADLSKIRITDEEFQIYREWERIPEGSFEFEMPSNSLFGPLTTGRKIANVFLVTLVLVYFAIIIAIYILPAKRNQAITGA